MSESTGDREPKAMIYEIRRRVQAARNRYWAEGVDGEISDECHRNLAIATLQYFDVLFEFRDESILEADDFPDISTLRERVGKKARQRTQQAGLRRPATFERVPAVTQIPVDDILEMSEDLDDLAKRLGFAAQSRQATEEDEVKEEHLVGLLQGRNQESAVSQLPARFRNAAEEANGEAEEVET